MDLCMTVHRKEIHIKQVEAWESRNAKDVSEKELPKLYAKAIQAIERRSLGTLSSVTVLVVVDRVIHETKEKFPLLNRIKTVSNGIDFSALFEATDVGSVELQQALRELLIELLSVLGNITADVLTSPLHKELMGVTNERLLFVAEPTALRSVQSVNLKREQK